MTVRRMTRRVPLEAVLARRLLGNAFNLTAIGLDLETLTFWLKSSWVFH